MREYARQRGLRRLAHPVPVLTPRLSSLWLGLVTPVYARVGRKLIESLRNETVVRDAQRRPSLRRSGRAATARRSPARSRTRTASSPRRAGPTPLRQAGRAASARAGTPAASGWSTRARSRCAYSPAQAFRADSPDRRRERLVLRQPPLAAAWLPRSARRRRRAAPGRRDPETPVVGEALDFWRVEAYEPDRLLRLRAEMRLPGRAWLQFEVDGRQRQHDPPDGDLRPGRAARDGLLVRPLPRSLADLQRHAGEDRRRCPGV